MKTAWPLFFGIFFLFLFISPVLAAMQMTFSGLPDNVDADNQFSADINLSDAPKGKKYYLRAALFESGKTSYFGYTQNQSGEWNNQSTDCLKFLEIASNEQGSWSGQLKAKADLASSYFKGGGEYQFKVGRYTEGCSLSWSDNEDSIVINYAAASPSPGASQSPNPSSSGNSSQNPSPTPSPSPTSSPSPTPQPSKIYHVKEINLLTSTSTEPILGTQSSEPSGSAQGKSNWQLPIMLLSTGGGILAITAFIIIRSWRKS